MCVCVSVTLAMSLDRQVVTAPDLLNYNVKLLKEERNSNGGGRCYFFSLEKFFVWVHCNSVLIINIHRK